MKFIWISDLNVNLVFFKGHFGNIPQETLILEDLNMQQM